MLCIPGYAIYIWIVTEGTVSEVKQIAYIINGINCSIDKFFYFAQKFKKLFRPDVDLIPPASGSPDSDLSPAINHHIKAPIIDGSVLYDDGSNNFG